MIDSLDVQPQEPNPTTSTTTPASQIFGSLYSDLPNNQTQDEINISAAAWSAHRSKILAPQSVRKRDAGQTNLQPLPLIKPPEKHTKKGSHSTTIPTTSPTYTQPFMGQIKSVLTHTSSTEYDPYKPHEYDKIIKQRLQKIQNEEMERKRKQMEAEELERLKKQQELNEEKAREKTKSSLKLSGDEAWARRGQINSSPSPNLPNTSSNFSNGPPDTNSSPSNSGLKKSVAARMMERMGWKDGEGLGREKQGMTGILIARKTDKRSGVIVQGGMNKTPPSTNSSQPTSSPYITSPTTNTTQNFSNSPNQANHTRILLLTNLVGPGDVDEDLEGEIQDEASKFGNLLEVKIYEQKGVPDDECVRIFCVYESSQQAHKALVAMNRRVFGGRLVKARFYDEIAFQMGDLKS